MCHEAFTAYQVEILDGSEQFEAFITTKAQDGHSYGLQSEGRRLAKFYGTNVDRVFHICHILSTMLIYFAV